MPGQSRIAFVTIGETPRSDIVPEMLAEIGAATGGKAIEAVEFGVLDGLSPQALDALRAGPDELSFATRRRSGEEIVVSKDRTEERLNALLQEIDGKGFDLVVLLCTGTRVEPLRRTLVVEAQRIVDATVEALGAGAARLGVMVPLARQVDEFSRRHVFSRPAEVVAASPYAGDDLGERALALRGCDLVVMHCMGYSAQMLEEVRKAVEAPVLLSRRVVAGAVSQML